MFPRLLSALFLVSLCYADAGSFEIKLPANVQSETFVIRYALTGAFGAYKGWLEQKKDLHSYRITTVLKGKQAEQLKSILYAPGCVIETIDIALKQAPASYEFECRPLSSIPVTGKLVRAAKLQESPLDIHVNYVPYWAEAFFGIVDGMVTTIPVNATPAGADGQFQVNLPDLAQDPAHSNTNRSGVFQFWAREGTTGNLLAELVPSESRAKFGSLKVERQYPPEIEFSPCSVSHVIAHTGFAKRTDRDTCGR